MLDEALNLTLLVKVLRPELRTVQHGRAERLACQLHHLGQMICLETAAFRLLQVKRWAADEKLKGLS
jgi:hypothetical protein